MASSCKERILLLDFSNIWNLLKETCYKAFVLVTCCLFVIFGATAITSLPPLLPPYILPNNKVLKEYSILITSLFRN
ncbi:hypothetical protein VNO78_01825 [Psophocarpus tetragonolobus]|uniref:Uncharacterized protein n=1 Tax=Psophocarpus tetragonolobus TaxID=3891 RepID=A0AAN9T1Z2_PSOTE